MNVVLVMVSSVNGKITQGLDSDVTHWTSPEDASLFASLKEKYNLIVMGSKTYQAIRSKIQLKKDTLRVVLTTHPEQFAADKIEGQLEFTDESPSKLIERLELAGYTDMLLTGGSEINSLFIENGLVNELHITIEPKLFGTGKNLLSESDLYTDMELMEIKRINDSGTLHLIYRVV